MNSRSRPPAVAGTFYPDNPNTLRNDVLQYISDAKAIHGPRPKFLIVPHAGYIYSGSTAAYAYRHIKPYGEGITRVVLMGPAHRVPLRGLAIPSMSQFSSPLGDINLDEQNLEKLEALDFVSVNDTAHALEHSLEVQLPFLQSVLNEFTLTPIIVGKCSPKELAMLINILWGGNETLFICSTDLSHYHAYSDAKKIDAITCDKIKNIQNNISGEQACGCYPLNGVLQVAQERHLEVKQLYYCNSGDTAGAQDAVVGYGAFIIGNSQQ